MILNSPTISGSLTVTGNIITSGSITLSGSVASASFATSASNATNAISASYANNLTVAGTLTAQTLVVQTITSSVSFITGSTRFGSLAANTHTFTGSILITGSNYISVGTPSPLYTTTLMSAYGSGSDVDIDVKNNTSAGAANLYLRSQTDGSGEIRFTRNSDNSIQGRIQFSQANSSMAFRTGGSDNRLFISASGNIGIGTATPYTILDIGAATPRIRFFNSSANTQASIRLGGIYASNAYSGTNTNSAASIDFYSDTAWYKGYMTFSTNGSDSTATPAVERMRITSDGLISVNTMSNSTNYKFGVSGSAYMQGTYNKGIFVTDNATYASIVGLNSAISAYNPIELRASGTDYQLYLTTGGQVNIGSSQTTYPFYVQAALGNWTAVFENTTSGASGILMRSTGGSQGYYYGAYDGGAYKFFVNGSGVVNSTSTSITIISSDIKLKTDIRDYDKGLAEVLAMKPRIYKRKDNLEVDEVGFIAQEMDIALSGSMIESYKDENEEAVMTYQLEWYPLLVKAIQELKTQNDALQSRIETLESK